MFQSCLQDVPMKNTVLETDCGFSNTYGSFVDVVAACGCKCLALLKHQNRYPFIQCCPDGPWHASWLIHSSHKAVAASINIPCCTGRLAIGFYLQLHRCFLFPMTSN